MTALHLMLQGTGGTGKTLIALLLAQCFLEKKISTICIDADPLCASLSHFKDLKVNYEKIVNDSGDLDPHAMDEMLEDILETLDEEKFKNENACFIVDNGSSCFLQLANYLKQSDAFKFFKQKGHDVIIHVPIVAGIGFLSSLNCLNSLLENFTKEDYAFVVWENPYYGKVENNGKAFKDTLLYETNKEKIKAIITLPAFDYIERKDLSEVLTKQLTFREAINPSSELSPFIRHRLQDIQSKLFDALDAENLL